MIRAAFVAATLVATPAFAQDAPARYQVELSLTQPDLQFRSTSQIIENSPSAETSITVNGVRYTLDISLFSTQGDGEQDQLLLESRLTRGDTELAAPRLTVLRGHIARIQLGDTNSGVIEVTLSPLAP